MKKIQTNRAQTQNLAVMGMFAALSIVAILFIRIPLIPAAPYLVYDMADIPIMLTALLINPLAGLAALAAVCLIQAFLLGGDGWIGMIMHFVASGAMVLIMGYIYRKYQKIAPQLIIGAVISTLVMTALMIPLNMFFTPILYGMPQQVVTDMIVPVLIPFNFIKAGLNGAMSIVLFTLFRPVYSKISKISA